MDLSALNKQSKFNATWIRFQQLSNEERLKLANAELGMEERAKNVYKELHSKMAIYGDYNFNRLPYAAKQHLESELEKEREQILTSYQPQKRVYRDMLTQLADEINIPITDSKEWMMLYENTAATYYNVYRGFNDANKAALIECEIFAAKARDDKRIKIGSMPDTSNPDVKQLRRFRVYYNGTILAANIIRHRTGLPLKEQVRRFWKAGVNPRVVFKDLPDDFEYKNNMDRMGNVLNSTPMSIVPFTPMNPS